jgi:hypothetical protein
MNLILSAALLFAFGQEPAPRNSNIQLIAVGKISKVEKIKKSFDLKSPREGSRRQTQGNANGEFRVGITFGRFPDATVQGLPGRSEPSARTSPFPDERNDSRFPEYTNTRVFVTEATVCKEGDKVILCDDLKTTDSVRVTGDERSSDPRGKGLYATEVVRIAR